MNGKSAICYQRMFGQNPWWPRYLGLFAKAGTVKIVTNTSPKLVDKCVQCMMEGYAEKMMSMYIICWAHLLDGCIQQGMWSGWGIYVSEKYRKILWSDSRRNRVSNTITAGRRGVWGQDELAEEEKDQSESQSDWGIWNWGRKVSPSYGQRENFQWVQATIWHVRASRLP